MRMYQRPFNPVTEDQEYRGQLIEKLFFDTINRDHDVPLPGVTHITRASTIADVRGVDGIVRCKNPCGCRRVPFQIKLGVHSGTTQFLPTYFGFRVPVLHFVPDDSPQYMRRCVAEILEHPEVVANSYDKQLTQLENRSATFGEQEIMMIMRQSRQQFAREVALDCSDHVFS